MKPTVFAVVQATIEFSVDPVSSGQTLEQLHDWVKREAAGKLNSLGEGSKFIVLGKPEFVRCVVKVRS